MRVLLTLLLTAVTTVAALAQIQPEWIRYQTISPDGNHIAFTYMGNLYRVPASGGEARQLTFHTAHDFMPVWSNDGSRIAFASDRYGNFNVFVMDAMGGAATRLTWHSNDEMPYAFSSDDSYVIFGAARQDTPEHRQFPIGSQPELYRVPSNGGRVGQIFTTPAELVDLSRDGSRMVYQDNKGRENEWRKHHDSAITRDIWLYDSAAGIHIQLSEYKGENRNPVFSNDETGVYYLSQEGGTFNVFYMPVDNPSARRQVTFFETHPVRFLSSGSGTLAFGFDGELYTMREGGEPRKVSVTIRTQPTVNPDRFISINGGVQEMAVSPNGKEIAFIARGEVFVTSTDGNFTKRITNTPQRERFVTWMPDGSAVVYGSERDGRWSLFKSERVRSAQEPFFYASTLLRESVLLTGDEDYYLPAFSPDGKKLAYIAGRRTLRVRDMESGRTVDLLTPDELIHMQDGDQSFEWSPDGQWLLVSWRRFLHNGEVLIVAADGSRRVNLTQSGFRDSSPKWIGKGDQIIWFTNRDGLRSNATSGQSERDVYAMFLTQDAWDRHNMSENDYKLMKEVEKQLAGNGNNSSDDAPLVLDLEKARDRVARLTIHSSQLSDAVLSKDGEKLYYLTRFEENTNLWETTIRTRETKQLIRLNGGPGSLAWDKDMENLYFLSRGAISKLNLTAGSSSRISISGEMEYDAVAEREHMLEHVYIRTKHAFYEPTYHGIDWTAMYEHYQRFIPHMGNSYEFAEMLSELLGELNVSHSGARFSTSIDNADATASLGIFKDFSYEGNGIRIMEVITGGPLDRAAFDIRPGMIIEKIDGETVTPDRDVASYLNRKAGSFVLLEVTGPGARDRKEITVKPITLAQERALLYLRFVRLNEQEVEERSGGRLGYVHIPGMSDGPYRSVIHEMLGRFADREAIVVDTRFNGGGDLVADLVMFFTGEVFSTYATATRDVGGEPTARWTRPTITLFNEANYSDGHCYAAAYTELGLGLSVGMPVPGTCSFAGWSALPDGTRWGMVPVSARNKNNEWMENNQTYPDIQIRNAPGFVDQGRDQQLERAIEELLKVIDAE
jgi:tricorn protease